MTQYITPADEDLRQIYERLARHLTGRAVVLRLVAPAAKNATGESFVLDGVSRINIAPGISVQDSYNILLEECAHIRLNHVGEITAKQYEVSAQLDARELLKEPAVKHTEREAAKQVDSWREYAHTKIAKSLRHGTTEKQRAILNVTALLNTKWIGA